jgi:hypothetical protein
VGKRTNSSVDGAVRGAMFWDVDWAVAGAVLQSMNDHRHPELKDFLREASAGEGVSWKNGP